MRLREAGLILMPEKSAETEPAIEGERKVVVRKGLREEEEGEAREEDGGKSFILVTGNECEAKVATPIPAEESGASF